MLLQNFAVDLVGRERFNLLIGGVFLVIVLFSSDGLLGWWAQGRRSLQARLAPRASGRPAGGREGRASSSTTAARAAFTERRRQ